MSAFLETTECQNWEALKDHFVPHKETGPEQGGDLGRRARGSVECLLRTEPSARSPVYVPDRAVFGGKSLGESNTMVLTAKGVMGWCLPQPGPL